MSGGVERHLELMSRKGDTRQDSVNSVVSRRPDGAKTDLKAKSIAAALERVRSLFKKMSDFLKSGYSV